MNYLELLRAQSQPVELFSDEDIGIRKAMLQYVFEGNVAEYPVHTLIPESEDGFGPQDQLAIYVLKDNTKLSYTFLSEQSEGNHLEAMLKITSFQQMYPFQEEMDIKHSYKDRLRREKAVQFALKNGYPLTAISVNADPKDSIHNCTFTHQEHLLPQEAFQLVQKYTAYQLNHFTGYSNAGTTWNGKLS